MICFEEREVNMAKPRVFKIVPDDFTPGFLPFAPSGPPAFHFGVQNRSGRFCVNLASV
jgi:hypothetical protein